MVGGWKSRVLLCFRPILPVIGIPVLAVHHSPVGEVLLDANPAVAVIRTCATLSKIGQRLKYQTSLTLAMLDTINKLMLFANSIV